MSTTELQELMDVKDWTRTDLASQLRITANAIDKWFKAGVVPGGPTSILLMDWLIRARQGEPLRAMATKERKERQPA